MEGVHEIAVEIFVQIIAARAAHGPASVEDATDAARESYVYAKAFLEQHGRHLERGA